MGREVKIVVTGSDEEKKLLAAGWVLVTKCQGLSLLDYRRKS